MSSSNLKNLRDFDVIGGQNSPFPIDFAPVRLTTVRATALPAIDIRYGHSPNSFMNFFEHGFIFISNIIRSTRRAKISAKAADSPF